MIHPSTQPNEREMGVLPMIIDLCIWLTTARWLTMLRDSSGNASCFFLGHMRSQEAVKWLFWRHVASHVKRIICESGSMRRAWLSAAARTTCSLVFQTDRMRAVSWFTGKRRCYGFAQDSYYVTIIRKIRPHGHQFRVCVFTFSLQNIVPTIKKEKSQAWWWCIIRLSFSNEWFDIALRRQEQGQGELCLCTTYSSTTIFIRRWWWWWS